MKKSVFLMLCVTAFFSFSAAMPAAAFDSVTPAQAYDLVVNDANYYIIDVRTANEWKWVGHPGMNKLGEGAGLQGKVINIASRIDWQDQFIVNPSFVSDINELFGEKKDTVTLIMMCRSGDRGAAAAALLEGAGYRAMNMLTGFQGVTNSRGYRTVNGWANNGLPYVISGVDGYAD
jgi:rhodanese-related sulfurtransferase